MKDNKWDKYFLDICNTVASNSKCHSRKVGAIIVKDKSIISTGYNGPARNVPNCSERGLYDNYFLKEVKQYEINNPNFAVEEYTIGFLHKDEMVKFPKYIKMGCPRHILNYKSGMGLHLCVAGHGERNAIVNAAKIGVSVDGCTLYCNCNVPCKDCLTEIINSGISEIVCTDDKTYYDEMSEYIIRTSGIKVRMFSCSI